MRGAGNVSLQQRQRGVDATASTQCDEVVNYSRGLSSISQTHTHTQSHRHSLHTSSNSDVIVTSSRSRWIPNQQLVSWVVSVLVDCFTTEAYWSFCPVNPTCRPPHTVYIQSTRSNSTQDTSFRRRSSQPICWRSTQETRPNTSKANKTGTK